MLWAVAVLAAAWFAKDADRMLQHGIGAVEGSESAVVEKLLTGDFDHPYFPTAFVTVKAKEDIGGSAAAPAPELEAVLADLRDSLRGAKILKGVRTALDGPEVPITADGRLTFALLGVRANSMQESERLVEAVRELIAPVRERHPKFELCFVSEAAINYDVEHATFQDVTKAEKLALPLALIVLIFAFGSVVAAATPVVVGFVSVVIALGALFGIAHAMPLSAFAMSITTMMGLGLGIDYALFVLMRFREERAAGKSVKAAAAIVVHRAGYAILSSGLTVLIGLTALLTSGLRDPVSIGLGGLIVVAIAVLSALTLLPAILVLLGDRIDALPLFRGLSDRWTVPWGRVALWVTERPWRAILIALVALLPLILPAFNGRNGFPPAKFFPQGLESSIGAVRMEEVGQNGGLAPIFVAITPGAGHKPTDLAVIRGLHRMAADLRAEPGVQEVFGLASLRRGMSLQDYLGMYLNPGFAFAQQPQLRKLFLSKDGRTTIVQILPRNDLDFNNRLELARRVRALLAQPRADLPGAHILVGGPAAMGADITDRLEARFPLIVGGVVLATYVVLLLTFNSWILPLSAILLNALTVLGGYGALVLVFQEGWFATLLGLPGAVGSVNVMVPLVVFCLVFGLSMDYEVFMLSRIAEAHEQHRDTRLATAQGLAATARVITSAASIMVVVFGSFTLAGGLPIKMFGLGLAVAVFIDATLIRLLLVPATVRLVGRYNWVGPLRAPAIAQEPELVAAADGRG